MTDFVGSLLEDEVRMDDYGEKHAQQHEVHEEHEEEEEQRTKDRVAVVHQTHVEVSENDAEQRETVDSDIAVSCTQHDGEQQQQQVFKTSERAGEALEVQFLFQQISVSVKMFDSVLFHNTFRADFPSICNDAETQPFQLVLLFVFNFTPSPQILLPGGIKNNNNKINLAYCVPEKAKRCRLPSVLTLKVNTQICCTFIWLIEWSRLHVNLAATPLICMLPPLRQLQFAHL